MVITEIDSYIDKSFDNANNIKNYNDIKKLMYTVANDIYDSTEHVIYLIKNKLNSIINYLTFLEFIMFGFIFVSGIFKLEYDVKYIYILVGLLLSVFLIFQIITIIKVAKTKSVTEEFLFAYLCNLVSIFIVNNKNDINYNVLEEYTAFIFDNYMSKINKL